MLPLENIIIKYYCIKIVSYIITVFSEKNSVIFSEKNSVIFWLICIYDLILQQYEFWQCKEK
jgi:hypothetical protein